MDCLMPKFICLTAYQLLRVAYQLLMDCLMPKFICLTAYQLLKGYLISY